MLISRLNGDPPHTIESLLVVNNNNTESKSATAKADAVDLNILPATARLWCGLGNGEIAILDAKKGKREHALPLHKQIVTSVVAVGHTVWSGTSA